MGSQEYFRDVVDHLTRINGSVEAIRDTIGTAIHVNLSMVTIEDGEVTKRLAAWAAIFAVCTALAGIWVTGRLVDRHLRIAVLFSLASFAAVAVFLGHLRHPGLRRGR